MLVVKKYACGAAAAVNSGLVVVRDGNDACKIRAPGQTPRLSSCNAACPHSRYYSGRRRQRRGRPPFVLRGRPPHTGGCCPDGLERVCDKNRDAGHTPRAHHRQCTFPPPVTARIVILIHILLHLCRCLLRSIVLVFVVVVYFLFPVFFATSPSHPTDTTERYSYDCIYQYRYRFYQYYTGTSFVAVVLSNDIRVKFFIITINGSSSHRCHRQKYNLRRNKKKES